MSKTSRIRDNNMYGTVADFLKDKIQDGASLSFVSAYFTINAFNALRDSLTGIDNLRFLFGEPDVIGGMDPSKTESKAFRLTEEGLGLRNELSQNEIAKACADWIEKKVKIKSVRKSNFLHGKMYYIENGDREDAIIGSSNFTVRGLGLSNFLRTNRRSNISLYPDDWKQLPIPDVLPEQQVPIIELVDKILAAKRKGLERKVVRLEKKLDKEVSVLYGVEDEE